MIKYKIVTTKVITNFIGIMYKHTLDNDWLVFVKKDGTLARFNKQHVILIDESEVDENEDN